MGDTTEMIEGYAPEQKFQGKPRHGITHGGVFHADDIFATAALLLVNPHIFLLRVPNDKAVQKEMDERGWTAEDTIVYDIGGGRYDHHTRDSAEVRPSDGWCRDPNPYAAFGKIMRDFYPQIGLSEKAYRIIESKLIIPVDRADCNGKLWHNVQSTLNDAISLFNPSWMEEPQEEANNSFWNAVGVARQILERAIVRANAIVMSEDEVAAAVSRSGKEAPNYIILEKYVNYNSYVPQSCSWVCYPSMRGGIQIYSVVDRGVNRGLIDDDSFNMMSRDDRCTFVHPGRFTAVFTNLETAEFYLDILTKPKKS